AHERARVQLRPLARRDGDLGELLARRAELVDVTGRGERVAGRRPGEPERLLELETPRIGAEARSRHADARRTALAVRDERDVTEPGVDGGHRVLDVRDERAAADLRTVDVARPDAQVLGRLGAHPESGAEDGVDV